MFKIKCGLSNVIQFEKPFTVLAPFCVFGNKMLHSDFHYCIFFLLTSIIIICVMNYGYILLRKEMLHEIYKNKAGH